MAAIFAFKCSCCGEIHEGSPSFGFLAPDQYASLTTEQKEGMGTLTEDLCTITHGQGIDYFIRAVLEVPIHGVEDPFLWGVWVSVSQRNYKRYTDAGSHFVEGEGFFGWVCNEIAVYPHDQPRPSDVFLQPEGNRPTVVLHRRDPEVDRLAMDQFHGIAISRAQELAERALHEA
jgi:hypothetical protein